MWQSSSWTRSLTCPLKKSVEIPHVFLDKVVDVPVVCNVRCLSRQRGQLPQLQFVDKVAVQTSTSGGYGGLAVCEGACCCLLADFFFRNLFSWTLSARLVATFLSPRWPTVLVVEGSLRFCLDSISTETSLSISRPHHHHHLRPSSLCPSLPLPHTHTPHPTPHHTTQHHPTPRRSWRGRACVRQWSVKEAWSFVEPRDFGHHW